jgi:hypothetical protein
MSAETKIALIGDFFKPSAFEAAIFGAPDQVGFEKFCTASAYPASGIKPAKLRKRLMLTPHLKTRFGNCSALESIYCPIFKKIIHLLPLEFICMCHITPFCHII